MKISQKNIEPRGSIVYILILSSPGVKHSGSSDNKVYHEQSHHHWDSKCYVALPEKTGNKSKYM
jgi:hypothetical protein